jgi:hypothetical protein
MSWIDHPANSERRPLMGIVKQQLGVAPNLFRLIANCPAERKGRT